MYECIVKSIAVHMLITQTRSNFVNGLPYSYLAHFLVRRKLRNL